MKVGFLGMALGLLSTAAVAKVEFIGLHSHFQSKTNPEIVILKLEDGRTAFWNQKELSTVELRELDGFKGTLGIELDQDQKVLSMNLLESFAPPRPTVGLAITDDAYRPSILANYSVAQDVMKSFNLNIIDGAQCYDKAHRWVYEEKKNYDTNLLKMFLFFSDSYIERYNYQWWFHTAPLAQVRMNNETTERVMDPTFSQYPLKVKLWTDIFMKNKAECLQITKYSQYVNDRKYDCYVHRATMYFWQPKDLDSFEQTGEQKTSFIPWEIDWAYEHGFGIKRPQ